jgi:hypothetical protein
MQVRTAYGLYANVMSSPAQTGCGDGISRTDREIHHGEENYHEIWTT